MVAVGAVIGSQMDEKDTAEAVTPSRTASGPRASESAAAPPPQPTLSASPRSESKPERKPSNEGNCAKAYATLQEHNPVGPARKGSELSHEERRAIPDQQQRIIDSMQWKCA
ncbi:hypothetical protein AB0B50_21005 [Streptomyces sp. NPDC041068]|uniref:hypothetical protein n=1 Tax=Streptomyces sp. NPDC041068 TaxID=3155130 RepID=UPI0033DCFDBC